MMKINTLLASVLLCAWASGAALAQDRFAEVEIKSQHLAGSVYMLTGAGGNIGVSAGEEGLLIIDDQYEPLAKRISAALDEIVKGQLKYVINTHYHGDHTGSNAYMREVRNSTVLAHENVRKRLAENEQHTHNALPVVTYAQGINLHFNGETINVSHLSVGHTDGDSIVLFEQANVLHTGDLFFKDRFPYIDLSAGGSVAGYIANVENIIAMIDDETQVIPGHGDLANRADLQRFVDMIKQTNAEVQHSKKAGNSVEQVVANGLNEKWKAWSWSFINEEKWIKTLYQ